MRDLTVEHWDDFSKALDNNMKKEEILNVIRKRGGRITKSRKMLLDIILDEECYSCKEIFYKALKKDPDIGIATVYRTFSLLEDMGVISRNKLYEVNADDDIIAPEILAKYIDLIYSLKKSPKLRIKKIMDASNKSREKVMTVLKHLEAEGCIIIEEDKYIILTEKGKELGREYIERDMFLQDILKAAGVDSDTAKKEGKILRESLSDDTYGKFINYLKSMGD